MSVNESIVEATALEWFGELGYAVGQGPQLAPGEPAAVRDSFWRRGVGGPLARGDSAAERRTLLPKLLGAELNVAETVARMATVETRGE